MAAVELTPTLRHSPLREGGCRPADGNDWTAGTRRRLPNVSLHSTQLPQWLSALQAGGSTLKRQRNGGYLVQCPAHEDLNPSLSVTEEGGKVLVKCFAGCSYEAIGDALGLTRPRGAAIPTPEHTNATSAPPHRSSRPPPAPPETVMVVVQSDDRLLRRREVEERTGLSRASIYRLKRDGRFPAPVRVSDTAVRWKASDITVWIQSRPVATSELGSSSADCESPG